VFEPDGFYLNGERTAIFGLNRHQLFPYTGMAAPARLQRRDAEILRLELNCNMVRCSHYPQSPHFLDACDELGLMVWPEPPGWQYVGDAEWQAIMLQNTSDMVVRDRSRPSVIVWGTRLDETANYASLYARARSLAYQLDGSRQTTGAMDIYSTSGWAEDVFGYDYYHSHDARAELMPPLPGVPYLVSEAVGALDGSPTYRWIDPGTVLAEQAVMHAEVHSIARANPGYAGVLGWAGIDYASLNGGSRPHGPGANAMIATNCDRLEIYVGGAHVATGTPDTRHFGGLAYPPVFADLTVDGASPPELRIDGYLGTRLAASVRMSADTTRDRLALTADDASIRADGTNATRVTFRALDAYGNQRPHVTGQVSLSLTGPATFIGDNPFEFGAYGGVGGGFVRSQLGRPGLVSVTVSHPVLGRARVRVTVARP
jgi:beta-galactosidase